MSVNEKLRNLKILINSFVADFIYLAPISRRLRCISILTEIYQVQMALEDVRERIEMEIDKDVALIDFKNYKEMSLWIENGHPVWLNEYYTEQKDKDTIINHMVDILPLNEANYTFTSAQSESFKNSMHQFCDDSKLEYRSFSYSLYKGLKNIIDLLKDIQTMTTEIPPYRFEEFWAKLSAKHCKNNEVEAEFRRWKHEHAPLDLDILKEKLEEEIIALLNTGVFSHGDPLYTSEIKKSKVKIDDENLQEDCARFSKQVEKYNTILVMDYSKLGEYVYYHLDDLYDNDLEALANFDKVRELITNEMIKIEPSLEADSITKREKEEAVFEECARFIEKCNKHLLPTVNPHILRNILKDLYNGKSKSELREKLEKSSKYITLCEILASIKNSQKVFNAKTTFEDLATSLAKDIEKPSKNSLRDYLKKSSADSKTRISILTSTAITNHLKQREVIMQEVLSNECI